MVEWINSFYSFINIVSMEQLKVYNYGYLTCDRRGSKGERFIKIQITQSINNFVAYFLTKFNSSQF